ncbi:60S ribosomal protein [Histoplasma capsulatum var. duboisii H88]|uniref:60S ribosomal protein L36 n=1 Tax=Ajellomyces capsulatus (strain H88) TaxID=544711 RepID=F0UA40_AJEC8|nr:60S ribosomal protein [Histoplasma capsulatum var. duboisii H88]
MKYPSTVCCCVFEVYPDNSSNPFWDTGRATALNPKPAFLASHCTLSLIQGRHFNPRRQRQRQRRQSSATPTTIAPSSTIEMAKERSGIAVGLNKGHKTTANTTKTRISRTKGHLSRRTKFVRDIVKEVAGLAPYERRVVELLRNAQDKRARKLAKKRLGTFGRAKRKVDEMQGVIAEAKRAGH